MRLIQVLCLMFICSFYGFAQPVEFSRDPFVEITDLKLIEGEGNEIKSITIKLTGIIWDDESPAAALDVSGKTSIVYENSTIVWIRVSRILSSSIILEGKDKQYMLKLGEEITL